MLSIATDSTSTVQYCCSPTPAAPTQHKKQNDNATRRYKLLLMVRIIAVDRDARHAVELQQQLHINGSKNRVTCPDPRGQTTD
jgi:hypothetical protein